MWQEIIVGLIGIAVIVYIGWKIYKSFKNPPQKNHRCNNCCGCPLKK